MIPPILTERLTLRTPTIEDLSGYLAYRNEPSALAAQMMEITSETSARNFLHSQSQLAPDAFGWRMFAIEPRHNPGLIGEVGVFISEDNPEKGDMGWWMSASCQGQGYATEAAKALVAWCFTARKMHRLTAQCLAANATSRSVMRKLGMRLESQTVESRFLAGLWHDEVGYAILRHEWTKNLQSS